MKKRYDFIYADKDDIVNRKLARSKRNHFVGIKMLLPLMEKLD